MSEKLGRRAVTLLLASLATGFVGCNERKPAGETTPTAAEATEAKTEKKAEAAKPAITPGVTDTTIKIGSWGPISGPAAVWASVLYGMDAYFSFINDKGGIHGRKIEFIYRDDQYNPAKTPPAVRELVEQEGVFAMVGGIGTANGRAVNTYLTEKGVPFFSPASGDAYWSSGEAKNVFTVFPRYLTEGEVIGNYVGKDLGAKRVAVLYQNDDFGKQGLQGVKNGLAKIEGADIVAEVSCLPTDTDLSGHASKIAQANADVLVMYAGPKQAITAAKILEAQKKKPQIVTSFVLSDPLLFKLAGKTWNGTITSAVSNLPDSDDPSIVAYKEVLAKYGDPKKTPPGTFTIASFLFVQPMVEALEKAGPDLTREKFMKALEGIKDFKTGGPHWTAGPLGPPVTFGPGKRLGVDQVFLAKGKEGKWEKVTDWRTPNPN